MSSNRTAFWLRWLALWVILQSFVYPEITFIDGNMQNAMVDLATTLVERGSVEITGLHVNSPDMAFRDGKFYSGMAPGVSWLAVPVYVMARELSQHLPARFDAWIEAQHKAAIERNPIPTVWPKNIYFTYYYKTQIVTHMLLTTLFGFIGGGVGVLLVARLMRGLRLSAAQGVWAAAIFALGTPLLFYNAAYYTQSVALLLLLCVLNLLFASARAPWHYAAAAFCAALAGACDYPFFLYAGLTLLFGLALPSRLSSRARVACMFVGGIVPFAGALYYNHAAFGGILHTSYAFRYRNPYPHASGLGGITLPHLARVWALLFGSTEGIVRLAPALLLALPGGIAFLLDRRVARPARILFPLLLSLAAIHFCGIPWNSDTAAYGPRFFLPGLLVLAVFAGAAAPAWRAVALALVAVAYLVNHLHMVGGGVPLAMLLPGGDYSINLWPVTQTYAPAAGWVLDVGYLALTAALAAIAARLLARRAASASPS